MTTTIRPANRASDTEDALYANVQDLVSADVALTYDAAQCTDCGAEVFDLTLPLDAAPAAPALLIERLAAAIDKARDTHRAHDCPAS